ncbi:MAG: hypothetical protein Tsb0014_09210 [Pleurocapsa sp.]
MNQHPEDRTYQEDGIRPIEHRHIEIAATFQDAGTRPIEESPDFLVEEHCSDRNLVSEEKSTSDRLNTNKILELDDKRPVNNS